MEYTVFISEAHDMEKSTVERRALSHGAPPTKQRARYINEGPGASGHREEKHKKKTDTCINVLVGPRISPVSQARRREEI